MKYSELYRLLSSAGCYIVKHGKCHDLWVNPKTQATSLVARHPKQEVPKWTELSIKKKLLI